MTILTPTMQLEKPESGDLMEPYFLGTTPSGSFWTVLTRLSEHDHTGGTLGKTLTAATIPDGSITPSKLHPSVYDPLTLVDGSKPFTGTQEFLADAVIRDRLSFGEQGTSLAPDVALTRTAAGTLQVATAPSGGTPLTARLQVGQTGAVALAPDAGVAALSYGGWTQQTGGGGDYYWSLSKSGTAWLLTDSASGQNAAGGHWVPNAHNGGNCGLPARAWSAFYSVAGAINPSSAAVKEAITPLDPAAALAAVLATDPVTFTYTAPAPGEEQYALPDDPEEAERVLYGRLVNEPLLAAARRQAGFVLASPDYATDPLFETGEGQSNAANTAGILLASIKELARRLTAGGL